MIKKNMISIIIGEDLVETANKTTELSAKISDIQANGELKNSNQDQQFKTLFEESYLNRYKCRKIMISTKKTEKFKKIKFGKYRQLYKAGNLLELNESLNLAKQTETTMEIIRKNSENCQNFNQLFLTYSMSNPETSPFTVNLIKELRTEYPKIKIAGILIDNIMNKKKEIIAGNSNLKSFVKTFGEIQSNDSHPLLDIEFPFEISEIENQAKVALEEDYKPVHTVDLLAHYISNISKNFLSNTTLNLDLQEMVTNLVPKPSVNKILTSLSFIRPLKDDLTPREFSEKIFHNVLVEKNSIPFLNTFLNKGGKLMATSFHYFGDWTPSLLSRGIGKFKTYLVQFVDWCPTGFKCGINYSFERKLDNDVFDFGNQGLFSMINNSVLKSYYEGILKVFNERELMCDDLRESFEVLNSAIMDYREVEEDTEVQEEEEYYE